MGGWRLACLGGTAMLASLWFAPAAIAAAPTDKELQNAIEVLQVCKVGNADIRPSCSIDAIQGILDRVKIEAGCAKKSTRKPGDYVVVSTQKCIDWLASLKGAEPKTVPPVAATTASAPSMLGPDASLTPASKADADVGPLESAAPAASSKATAAEAVKKNPSGTSDGVAKADSGAQPMLLWIATGIAVLLLAGLVIGYLKFSGENAKLEALLADRDRKLAKVSKDNQQLQDALVVSRREASAPAPIPKRDPLADTRPVVANWSAVEEAAPPSVKRAAPVSAAASGSQTAAQLPDVAAPKPERQALTQAIVEDAILNAIASLANDRSSLTEANFINKVGGVTTDATLKAVLLTTLEPALFFLCSGARSPQGPELVAYRFKGKPDCRVVPYPSAGRVGQFNRWFENASSLYGVSPVLASKAAVGVIGADGNLSVSALGVLV
jgi:hypothetical protein